MSSSWLTNSALVYEPEGGGVAGSQSMSTHGAEINFGDLTPYLFNLCPERNKTTGSEQWWPPQVSLKRPLITNFLVCQSCSPVR
jgi:hypothetical protein